MSTYQPETEDYTAMAKNLETLYKAKSLEKSKSVSPDVKWQVVGAFAATLLVLYFEKANVITSKAFGSVFRGRV